MTDELRRNNFRAPPLPTKSIQMPSHKDQEQVEGNASFTAGKADMNAEVEMNPYANNIATELNLPPQILQTKPAVAILAAILVFGMMLGCVMGGAGKKPVIQGLGDVVRNPHVVGNMRRCGQIDPNRECILYIMNSKNYDQLGEAFFQTAQDITDVPKYSIQLSNTNYANALIQPGYIAQIYIPARR